MVSRRLQACFQQVSKHSVHLFWSFDCFASLRAHSRAGALAGPSAAPLRFAPRVFPARLLRFASRSLPGWRPDWSLGCCASRSRLGWRPRLVPRLLRCAPPCLPGLAPPTGPSTASLRFALAPGLAPPTAPSAAPLRCAPRVFPRSAAPLRSALAPGLRPGSPRLLRFALAGLAPRLLRFASRSRLGWRPGWSLDCFAALRASCLPRSTAPLRSAPRVFPRSTAPLRSALAPGLAPRLLLQLLRCAPRLVSSPLDCSAALRARAWAGAPDCPFECSTSLRARLAEHPCVRDFTSVGAVLRWRAQRRTLRRACSINP